MCYIHELLTKVFIVPYIEIESCAMKILSFYIYIGKVRALLAGLTAMGRNNQQVFLVEINLGKIDEMVQQFQSSVPQQDNFPLAYLRIKI